MCWQGVSEQRRDLRAGAPPPAVGLDYHPVVVPLDSLVSDVMYWIVSGQFEPTASGGAPRHPGVGYPG